MAEIPSVMIEFTGDTSGLKEALKTVQGSFKIVEKQSKQVSEATKHMGASTIAAGGVMASAITQITGEVAKFGKEFLTTFTDTAKETKGLQRILGGTAEEMSRLVFASNELGVSTQLISGFMTRLSGHLSANDKAAKNLGVAYRDSKGNLLSSQQVLFNLADKFKGMPAGIDRTALAIKTFGRAGTGMLPILQQGSAGLKEMYANADKLGLTMSGKDLKAASEYTVNMKQMHATIQGLQLSIGRDLIPKITSFMYVVRDVTLKVTSFIKTHQTLIKILAVAAATFIAVYGAIKLYNGIASAVKEVTEGVGKAMKFMGEMTGLASWEIVGIAVIVVALIAAFVWAYKHIKGFANGVNAVIHLVATGIGYEVKAIATYIKFMVDIYMKAIGLIIKGAQLLAPILNAAGVHILDGADSWASSFDNVKNKIDDTLQNIKDNAVSKAQSIGDGLADGLEKGMNFDFGAYLKGLKDKFKMTMPDISKDIPVPAAVDAKTKKRKTAKQIVDEQYKALMKEIASINSARGTIDAQFTLGMSKATNNQQRLAVAQLFRDRAIALVTAAQAEEKKTRNTAAHTAAVNALNSAMREQAKLQNSVAKTTKAIADETARANMEIARMNSSMSASNSWLAAQTRTAGPTQQNFGGFIEVPVVIDGQTVFRATQRYSLLNDRRNPTNGQSISGSLI